MKNTSPSTAARAFSLIELLVVISVIAIIAAYSVPAVTTMIRGSQLSQGSQVITDVLALARQTALSKNRPVEVRFYKFADPETPGETANKPETGFFRALQVFETLDNGATLPMGPIQRLPKNVIMNEGKLSTILDNGERPHITKDKLSASDPAMPDSVVGKNYEYSALRFLPDGSTDLSTMGATGATGSKATKGDVWYITMHGTNVAKNGENDGTVSGLPDNYFVLQIDAVTGSTRAYRPNVQ